MATHYLDLISKVKKLPIYIDVDTLDTYCEYVLNDDDNKHINYANLLNLQEYIEALDINTIKSNDAKYARYQFVKYYLDGRLNNGLTSRKLAIKHIMDNADKRLRPIIQREIIDGIEPGQLNTHDIQFINASVYAKLNVMFLHKYKIGLGKIVEDLDSDSIETDEDMDYCIEYIQTLLSDMTKAKRRSKQENRFNLTDPILFNSVMAEACDRLLSDSQFLTSGFKGLDLLLDGGFENARIYNFIGATGGFKSGLLLNLMKTIKKNNKRRARKDPTKRATILFISQENNIWETINRIFSIFGKPDRIRNHKPEEIMQILKDGGFCVVEDEDDIDIEFRYYGNADVGVPDLRGIYEELFNQGREVICIIQDYIERLKPPVASAERRIQLFDISNQMHDLAQELDIPIITGSQFNKNGVATIETMQNAGKADIGKNVGTNDISESFAMLKNFDTNIGIVIEFDSKEEKYYLSFRKLKLRGGDSQLDYFLQPFVGERSKIQLMEDGPLEKSAYRLSLRDDEVSQIKQESTELNRRVRRTRDIIDINFDSMDSDSDDFFKQISDETEAANKRSWKFPDADVDTNRDEDGFLVLRKTLTNGLDIRLDNIPT